MISADLGRVKVPSSVSVSHAMILLSLSPIMLDITCPIVICLCNLGLWQGRLGLATM